MTRGVIIRKASLSDAAAIAKIHRAALKAAMPGLPELHTPEEDFTFFHDNVLPYTDTEVAVRDDEIAAFCSRRDGWIDHLYVAPSSWRQGLGAVLITRCQEQFPHLTLWTFQRNAAARAFYRTMGFQETEFTDGSGNEEREPDVKLEWRRS